MEEKSNITPSSITSEEVKQMAFSLGWDDVGITHAKIPSADVDAYLEWLDQGYHGELGYMENKIRCIPDQILPNAKSAILFITNYKQPRQPFESNKGLIASYARGRDYHHLHRKRLKKMIHWLETRSGQIGIAKGFSDSSPVLEKALAVQAGLGWFGKNTLLIHKKFGTFILLSGLFTTLEFIDTVTHPRLPRCGSCQKCLDACPSKALVSPYKLDAKKCLSYHLIESKKTIPKEIQEKNPGYIFGCDACQDACPHNVRSPLTLLPEFSPQSGNGIYLSKKELEELNKSPERLFGTPLQRRGVSGLNHSFDLLNHAN